MKIEDIRYTFGYEYGNNMYELYAVQWTKENLIWVLEISKAKPGQASIGLEASSTVN